jgi:hypothetical protein
METTAPVDFMVKLKITSDEVRTVDNDPDTTNEAPELVLTAASDQLQLEFDRASTPSPNDELPSSMTRSQLGLSTGATGAMTAVVIDSGVEG